MNLIAILEKVGFRYSVLTKLTITSSILLLSACGISNFKPNFEKPSHYTLNPENGSFCKRYDSDESLKYCLSLIATNFSYIETTEIEEVYQEKVEGPNRVMNLINIIIQGNNLTYTSERLSNGLYKLPINEQTNTVWDVLFKLNHSDKK